MSCPSSCCISCCQAYVWCSQDTSYYPTWKLTSTDLHAVLNSLWESPEPETEKIVGNVELLPIINNPDSFPYHDHSNNDTLFVENLPECLILWQKLTSKDKISCLFTPCPSTMEPTWGEFYHMHGNSYNSPPTRVITYLPDLLCKIST